MLMEKPLPNPTEDSEDYWEACKSEQLSIPLCGECGQRWMPPSRICPLCLSEAVSLSPVSGRARLFSWIVVHSSQHPAFHGEPPFNVAIIQLEEGPRMHTRIDDVEGDDFEIGMELEVSYEEVDDEISLPIFKPAARKGAQ
jgi:uncharacterized OB-fold protein